MGLAYEASLRRAEAYRDAWGDPIDHGIRPVVAALWLHGFPTRWSCEGHLDHGSRMPFVTIALDRSADSLPLDHIRGVVAVHQGRLAGHLQPFQELAPGSRALGLTPECYRSRGDRFVGCAFSLRVLTPSMNLRTAQESMTTLADYLAGVSP
jgi:hypothetical protein